MKYKVRLDVFEGPFDLLVYLIERSKMNIYDIQISEITTQYLDYVKKMQEMDIELAQDFMVLAAELIRIKTRMLLPAEKSAAGEEMQIEDPRADLVRRLVEYKQFKEMGIFLDQQAEINSHIHSKPAEDLEGYMGEPEEIIKGSLSEFAQAFMEFILKKQLRAIPVAAHRGDAQDLREDRAAEDVHGEPHRPGGRYIKQETEHQFFGTHRRGRQQFQQSHNLHVHTGTFKGKIHHCTAEKKIRRHYIKKGGSVK